MSDDLTALEERFNLRLAAELADVRTEMRTGFADVRGELRTGLADVRTEIASTRALFEEKLRVQTWRLVTTMISLTAVVFALARFT